MLVCYGGLYAQDIHFSQFFNTPLNINPALSGTGNADHRFQANYRNQWSNVPVDYLTFSGGYDFHLTERTDTTNYLGLGVLFNYDQAGDLGFSNTGIALQAAYHMLFSDQWQFSPGVGLSFGQRAYDIGAIRSGNQWDGEVFDASIAAEQLAQSDNSFMDVAVGANLRYQSSYRSYTDFGVSLLHLLAPDQGLNNDDQEANLGRRLNAYVFSSIELADKFDVLLNGIYSNQNPYQEIVLNAQGKLYLNKGYARDLALLFGAGLRFGDAWYPMIGLQYHRWNVAASYDINFSDFNIATDNRGGLELSLSYLFTHVRNAGQKYCPIY